MEEKEKLSAWSGYAGISRGWVQVLDAKASFITAINLGMLATLWANDALFKQGVSCAIKWSGGTTTVLAVASISCALMAILPRTKLSKLSNRHVWAPNYKPVSFYGYIADNYGFDKYNDFKTYVEQLGAADLANEALEQHFTISQTAALKSLWLEFAGYFLMVAFLLLAITLILRLAG